MSLYKKRLINVDRVFVDSETGEIKDGLAVYFPRKIRAEGFFMAWQEGFERLATDKEITLEALRVINYMFARLDYENYIRVTQADIARALDMKPSNVSRAVKLLIDKDILVLGLKVGRSYTYRLNADFGWKGKIKNMKKYQDQRAKSTKSQPKEEEE